jgi:ribonuclease D
MHKHPHLISQATELAKVAEALKKADMIAVDTEFIRETSFFPKLEILQIATREESWVIDARAPRPALDPVLRELQNPASLKIFHAAQGDQECLYTAWGVIAKPSFDTSVAASLCGYGEGVGLAALLKNVLNVKIPKGHARTHWGARPLPQELIDYAHMDVEFLVVLAESLLAELDKLGRRKWALELSSKFENPGLYESNPRGIAERLYQSGRIDSRDFPVLLELVTWRETRTRELNVPRRWLADDRVLMDIAHVKPRDVSHLKSFRGLNRGEINQHGEALIARIRRAQDTKVELPPAPERTKPATASESRVMDLLRCYVGILADEKSISVRHLVTSDSLLDLVRMRVADPREWVEKEILTQGACDLVGAEIQDFLHGKRTLAVVEGQVRVT